MRGVQSTLKKLHGRVGVDRKSGLHGFLRQHERQVHRLEILEPCRREEGWKTLHVSVTRRGEVEGTGRLSLDTLRCGLQLQRRKFRGRLWLDARLPHLDGCVVLVGASGEVDSHVLGDVNERSGKLKVHLPYSSASPAGLWWWDV